MSTAREAPLTGEPQPVDNSTTGRSPAASCQCVVTVTHAERESLIACPNEAAEGNGGYCHDCTTDQVCWKAWDE